MLDEFPLQANVCLLVRFGNSIGNSADGQMQASMRMRKAAGPHPVIVLCFQQAGSAGSMDYCVDTLGAITVPIEGGCFAFSFFVGA